MKISVIIPTKNEQDNIAKLLKSIRAQTFKDSEIIIVDNYSTDNTSRIARRFTQKVFEKGPERSAQRNFGIGKAKGEYLLFLDADMELQKQVLEECYQLMRKNKHMAGLIVDEISKGNNFFARVKALEKEIYRENETIEAARFFRRSDVDKIGGFDEKLIAGEDWDLSQRISKFGPLGRIKSKIHHLENQSLWQDFAKKYYYAKNIKKYSRKYPMLWRQYQANPTFRIQIMLKKPKLILKNPIRFVGLLILKFAHYLAYTAAKVF